MSDQSSRQQAHFDAIAKQYIAARRDERHLLLKNLIWGGSHFAKLNLEPNPKVLEVMGGIGEGKILPENNLGVKIDLMGFDYSPNMMVSAKEIHDADRVFQADATVFVADRLV